MSTLYFAIYTAATATPTWDRVGGWSGTPVVSGSEAARIDDGVQTWATIVENLDSGTDYKIAFVWDDSTSTSDVVYSDTWYTDNTGSVDSTEVGNDVVEIEGTVALSASIGVQEEGQDVSSINGSVLNRATVSCQEIGDDVVLIKSLFVVLGRVFNPSSRTRTQKLHTLRK